MSGPLLASLRLTFFPFSTSVYFRVRPCPGRESRRLPNTLSILTPGWRGETQVMQMDLAGFAVSAGSACSSGKVRPSSVLTAMGIAPEQAGDAIRVSIGPTTDRRDVMRFADAWLAAHDRWRQRNDTRATAGKV